MYARVPNRCHLEHSYIHSFDDSAKHYVRSRPMREDILHCLTSLDFHEITADDCFFGGKLRNYVLVIVNAYIPTIISAL